MHRRDFIKLGGSAAMSAGLGMSGITTGVNATHSSDDKLSLFDSHDALALADLVRKQEISPTELLDEAILRVEKADESLGLLADRYYDFARNVIKRGLPNGPFTGVPFLRKDLGGEIEGLSSTAGIRILKDYRPQVTQVLSQRYMDAGLVIFGSTKVAPLGVTLDTDRSHYGACKNPWDRNRTPGGSSSGSGAVVGCGALPMAHGNDGAGSLRIPSAWCGAFAVKPSRGRLPNGPIYTEGWLGFAAEGTITRSVRDCAAFIDATMGRELGSRYDAPQPERSYLEETRRECRPLRIAVMEKTHAGEDFHPQHLTAVNKTAKLLEELGHQVEYAAPKLDTQTLSRELNQTIAVAFQNIVLDVGNARGKPVSDGELETLLLTFVRRGKKISGSDYARIDNLTMEIAYTFDQFMLEYDLVLSPTVPELPPKIGELYRHEDDYEKFRRHQDRYINLTQVPNVTGQPAMSVPLWWSKENLPIGMMFVARYGDESTLFALASQLEKAQPWWDKKPIIDKDGRAIQAGV